MTHYFTAKIAKIFVFLELFSLVLLICLSFFAYPQADDFGFANLLNNFGWLGSQINRYETWFGRFSSTMLIVSGVGVDFSILCKVFPILILSGYLLAFYLVSGKLFDEVSREFRWIFAITTMFVFVSGMPSLSQGIYWFTGAATYAPANIAVLIFLSLFDSIHKNKNYILLILLGVFIIGANEVAMILLMFFIGGSLLTDYKNKKIWLMFGIFAIFSLIVVLSPGNAMRSQMFVRNHNLLVSVFKSSKTLLFLMFKWLCNPLLWCALLFFFYFKSKFQFKVIVPNVRPWIIIVFMLFLMFCTLFPAFWSMNGRPPERALNSTYLIFLFFVFYLTNFLKSDSLITKIISKKWIVPVLSVWLCVNIYVANFDLPQREDFSFYLKHPVEAAHFIAVSSNQNNWVYVYEDLFSGSAVSYRKTMLEREEKIKNYKGGSLCLPKVEKLPKSIVFEDLSENPEQWENKVFAEYYHLAKVALCEND